MDDSFLFNQQKEQEKNIVIKEQEKATTQLSDMQPLQQMQNETAVTYDKKKLDPMQRLVYDKFMSSAEKMELVNASNVAEGSPVQEYKPQKESVKKKVSNWWKRSKNTKKAREQFKNKNADYMTLELVNQYSEAEGQASEQMSVLIKECEKNKLNSFAGLARSGIFMFQNYKKGIDGQPENEEEKAKKDANTALIKNYSSGKLEDRRPILNRLVNEALSFNFSPDMLDKEYIEHNFVDMQRKMTLLGELEGLLKVDEINKKYYEGLPQSVKSRLDFLADFHGRASLAFSFRLRAFNVTETGGFKDFTNENKELNMYPIEENGELVEKQMTEYDFHYHNYISFYKENKSKIDGAGSPMTVESAVKEEYMQKYDKDVKPFMEEDRLAKEHYNDSQADYITYRVDTDQRKEREIRKSGTEKFVKALKEAGVSDTGDYQRLARMLLKGYEQDENGNPINEEAKKNKEADDKFIEDYTSMKLEKRIPHLHQYINHALNVKFDLANYTEDNLYARSSDLILDILHIVNYQNYIIEDKMNKSYLDTLPDTIKQRFEDLSTLSTVFIMYFNAMLESHKLKVSQADSGEAYSYGRNADPYEEFDKLDENGNPVKDEFGDVVQEKKLLTEVRRQEALDFIANNQDLIQRLSTPMTVEDEIKKHGYKK